MRAFAYTRFELVRTFRNIRLLVFSLGFPLILFFIIAAPNRNEHNFNGSGISIPLYYMVGLVAFGGMSALISSGARIATERTDGWTRQLRVTPLKTTAYFRAKVVTGYAMAATTIALLYASGIALGVSLGAGRWLEMTRADPRRARPVCGARHPARAPAHRRLDRPGDRRHRLAAGAGQRHVVPARVARVPARHRSVPPLLLAGAGQPRIARRARVDGRRMDRRRRVDGRARDPRPLRLSARHRARLKPKQKEIR